MGFLSAKMDCRPPVFVELFDEYALPGVFVELLNNTYEQAHTIFFISLQCKGLHTVQSRGERVLWFLFAQDQASAYVLNTRLHLPFSGFFTLICAWTQLSS